MSSENGNVRWIALEGAANARVVVPGVLMRSDNLHSLTAREIRLLIEQESLEVVLDLRTELEVELEGPGPITREPRVPIEHRSLYPRSGGNTDFDRSARSRVRAEPCSPIAPPKDRTGVVVALALDAAGVGRDAIVSDYLATTARIDAIMARLVRSPTYRSELEGHDPQSHAPIPDTIERVLEIIDQDLGGSAT